MKTNELRLLANQAFDRSERARTLADVQWFLKVRRVLTEAAEEFERRHGQPAEGAAVVDLDGGPAPPGRVVRMVRGPW